MSNTILTLNDYGSLITTPQLTAVKGDEVIRKEAERAAQTEVKTYLRNKYDLVALFPTITEHNLASSYAENDIVVEVKSLSDKFWQAKTAVAAQAPLVEGANWQEISDPRDPLMKEILIDLTLYRLYTRLAPNQIPETRVQRRDDQINFLKGIAKFDLTVDWVLADTTDPATSDWGSKTKHQKDW